MSEPFLAEIRIVGFNFAPRGWAFCDGQILPINQNQSLYSLLGTTFGGDGRTTFALPDLRGRTAIHVGQNRRLGQKAGTETETLDLNQLPNHTHLMQGSSGAVTASDNSDKVLASTNTNVYNNVAPHTNLVDMNAGASLPTGGGQAHENMQPFLALNFCIALQGLFPSRN